MKFFLLSIVFFLAVKASVAQQYTLASPDGKLKLSVTISKKDIQWSVNLHNEEVIFPSTISLTVNSRELNTAVVRSKRQQVNAPIPAEVARKSKIVDNNYSEITLELKNNNGLVFRVYNDGLAYRFKTSFVKDILVNQESLQINFPQATRVLFPEEQSTLSDNERPYLENALSAFTSKQFCSLPMLATTKNNIRVLITDADVLDYPNMFLEATGTNSLKAKFPPVVLEAVQSGDRMENIVKEADYIAKTAGTRNLPWRVFTITNDDRKLAESDMVYKLSTPSVIKETSWIKPGQVSWDWWNANNIYGVDFPAGINTKTYKYYIDFASKYSLEYIILDEGWSASTTNLMESTEAINIPELVDYGKTKNVGIILWSLWKPLDNDMNKLLDRFAAWGVKGIKVDFMQRSDQGMVNYYERLAKACAERKLLVNFHGSFKPGGMHRKYPNIMSHEGVKGLEQNKWTHSITPEHNVTIPFTRMVAGPMDYTPGAMNNANKHSFRDIFETPMSMGTRCHQLAMYVVYESLLQMLADSPTNYYKEDESADFISRIPVTWDETHVISAKVSDYILTARRKGDNWYIGGMTDWDPRDFTVDFSFLPGGNFEAEIVQDGVNAHRNGNDYKKVNLNITNQSKLSIKMAPGGGWVAIIKRK
ncbi:glycoside hydrolase family 97 protein [Paradesertivirga mongoliensis]|uniref:Glycoside hydrolase family 97 protein n=1 Tax=Paradesertivirga mongoliensis TaxID=2100740 RepID=A0ABW4ZN34_9SPHI|nr:glycoside hydrolase family 97 protein [Pedobacter mongoliensis]